MHLLALPCCSSALPRPPRANDMVVGPKNKQCSVATVRHKSGDKIKFTSGVQDGASAIVDFDKPGA
jgi:hypothetical protein